MKRISRLATIVIALLLAASLVVPFAGAAPGGTVEANVIGIIENQAPTQHRIHALPVNAGEVHADRAQDVA